MTRTVPSSWLERVMDAALAARGLPDAPRREVVSGVLFGSLRGIDSHGVSLFGTYLQELSTGRAKVQPRFEYRQLRSAAARLDAGGALGIVAGFEATRRVATLAKEAGVGAVIVSNSNHFGAASMFTTRLASAGLIGLAMTNSDALVVPMNGRVPRMGTNPISMAVRGQADDLFCIDLSTSQGSFLRSLALRAAGASLPPSVLADGDGNDAAASGKAPAALLPLGGHKGQCLGMMVSILCAVLGGAPFDWNLANLFEGPFDEPRQISHFFLAVDVSALTDDAQFRARLSQYLRAFRSTPSIPGAEVTCPGDTECQTARRRAVEGVPIREDDYALLRDLERKLGI